MRKLILLLAALLLCCGLACADSASPTDLARREVENQLNKLMDSAAGWQKAVYEHAAIESIRESGDTVTVTVSWWDIRNGVPDSRRIDGDAEGYLRDALDPFLNGSRPKTTVLTADITEKNGVQQISWQSGAAPKNLAAALKKNATEAKKSYATARMRAAVGGYLFPKGAELPKKMPEANDFPVIPAQPQLGDEVGDALGVSGTAAGARLAPLLMLTEVSGIDVKKGLDQVVVTFKVKDWTNMPIAGVDAAKKLLQQQVGAPQIDRDTLETIFGEAMSDRCIRIYYKGKDKKVKLTVDLAKILAEGRGADEAYTAWLAEYMKSTDSQVNELLRYAATLPFYPSLEVPASAVLSGEADAEGCLVTIDMGDDPVSNAYLRVLRDGRQLWSAFIGNRMHLEMRMQPGSYTVLFGRGAGWYGETYLFTEEGEYGRFEMTVPDAPRAALHLSASQAGNLSIVPADWDTIRTH